MAVKLELMIVLAVGVALISELGAEDLVAKWGPRVYIRSAVTGMEAEASRFAREVSLPERLPITDSSLMERFVGPIAYCFAGKGLGNVQTANYCYYFGESNKLYAVDHTDEFAFRGKLMEEYRWPIARLDTNAAIRIAVEWLGRLPADVAALNAH